MELLMFVNSINQTSLFEIAKLVKCETYVNFFFRW